jgi:DNA-3-methyladenine glycosylase
VVKLKRDFYDRDTVTVARDLLGKLLVHRSGGTKRIGRIVEVEAYIGPQDLAAHTSKGHTPRTEVMFGPPGHAYVYLVYGIHCCVNVVTEAPGRGCAVLLRALEPVQNIELSTRGPGLLCKAMGIDLRLNRHDLCSTDFHLADDGGDAASVVRRPRVGVDYAGRYWARRLLRFYIKDNPWVSRA